MRWRRQKFRSNAMESASACAGPCLTRVDELPRAPVPRPWRSRLAVAGPPGANDHAGAGRHNDDGPRGSRGPSVRRLALQASGHVAELLGLRERLELLERLVLDLADALARHVERAADLVQRARVLPAQPVPQLEHAPLPVGEVLERLAQGLLGEDLGRALVRGLRALVGDELAELRLLLVADRLLQRNGSLRGALDRI